MQFNIVRVCFEFEILHHVPPPEKGERETRTQDRKQSDHENPNTTFQLKEFLMSSIGLTKATLDLPRWNKDAFPMSFRHDNNNCRTPPKDLWNQVMDFRKEPYLGGC